MKKTLWILVLAAGMLLPASCKKYLTIQPQGTLSEEQSFKAAPDAITAINGLYSLMLPLADQIFITGELRGELVSDARGADVWIKEFTDNRVTSSNPYCDYTKFYRLIIACNRTLEGLDQIIKNDPVNYNRNIYLINKAEAYYIRAWTYLQITKIWGDVPYITTSVTKAEDVSNLPVTKSETIIKNILKDAENNFVYLQTLSATSLGASNDFLLTSGQWRDSNSRVFLAELYLYDQNYQKALETMRNIFPLGAQNNTTADGSNAQAELGMVTGQFTQWTIGFDRSSGNYNKQVVMALNYDATKGQTNNLMKWTNNKYGAAYAVRPSSFIINDWRKQPMSLQQYQTGPSGYFINETNNFGSNVAQGQEVMGSDGYPVIGGYGDNYRAERGSYMVDGGDTLISKYLMKSRGVFKSPLIGDRYADNDAFFDLYRDGPVYLMGCEMLNNAGQSGQALLYLNGGAYYAYIYKGPRYRVGVAPVKIDVTSSVSIHDQVEKFILEEFALESAFEGRRWFDLVRFAKRNNDASILANAVARKYPLSQQGAIKARLMDRKNWYLPVYKK
ncbi:MAG: RagB/SusD family nutrient uptake outer membrane protein [Mucilaginibacter sp.]|uniref:RagB/SusD family nutrient uptake outer membrane protein n=1 Tax=Mucilaginibacter sp. TaxID=1882438 RepID=UPI0026034296|nr:RagB/SusD family nutrient uptake outer membrane protein [Mucilaginibacter sp.]MDB5003317.1 RagB/SusD family nutrient uptake outer membrane protein [Mucilaginibacter sp.]